MESYTKRFSCIMLVFLGAQVFMLQAHVMPDQHTTLHAIEASHTKFPQYVKGFIFPGIWSYPVEQKQLDKLMHDYANYVVHSGHAPMPEKIEFWSKVNPNFMISIDGDITLPTPIERKRYESVLDFAEEKYLAHLWVH
jgi:hypothetical protein